ncbi:MULTISPECIES: triose-phosphate isomerase [Chryseolinea]|jgi:triosephosphate isomerase|uniref:Triosephosphate isomerase n=2 Tax=Chryseolinea TaxID=1433993 RepID=A0A1M5XNI8_9BACT|nr:MULTISPECIES: triose-phosphate isomerase [Chryseolinea]AYB30788.1 triose-phosphate isomerase [Chryseolinea soli]SHI01397.1 triosephosphate isomerase [Chryseolinea serpens]
MRQKIVAGNWKMNKTLDEANILASEIKGMVADEVKGNVKVILCTPFPYLLPIKNLIGQDTRIAVAAQNCSEHESGAYTGEVSAAMLKSLGIGYVILGHSERRQYFGEDGKLLAKKVDIALKHGLSPIFCCGEPLEVRESNGHEALVKKQIEESLFHLDAASLQKVIVAYEPVWAIGTGKTATSQQAQDMHAVIRKHLASKYGEAVANEITIQYGGSVNAANAKELFSQPDVDGGLVGGASLKSREFAEIIKAM